MKKWPAWLIFWFGLTALLVSHGLVFYLKPVRLFYYPLAWWTLILTLEGYNSLRGSGIFLHRRISFFLHVSGISALIWFGFEAYNFYLGNWYYVFTLENWFVRWAGAWVCFATVLPGLWEVQRTSLSFLPDQLDESKSWPVPGWLPRLLLGLGVLGTVGPLVAPEFLYPFVWGGVLLVLEFVEYRSGGPTFLAQISGGRYRNLIGWLVAGGLCGFFWEFWNYLGRTGWIYTVPGPTGPKIFEMPLLGYLGFLPFSLTVWRSFKFIDRSHETWGDWQKNLFWTLAIGFSLLALVGMDSYTTVSTKIQLTDYQGWTGDEIIQIHRKNYKSPVEIINSSSEREFRSRARLLELGGMGTEGGNCLLNAGVNTVADFERTDIKVLARTLFECEGGRLTFWHRRVRTWKKRLKRHEGDD